MNIKTPQFLKWRYDKYISEYVDLYGSFQFYFRQRRYNKKLVFDSPVAYVYANKRNVGDYISYCGIKQLINMRGMQLFCSPVWSKNLISYLSKLEQYNPNCILVIGGGGLLQSVFQDFWEIILGCKLDYVLFGIGINKMSGRSELQPNTIKKIVKKAKFIVVRDTYTQNKLESINTKKIAMNICPSANYISKHYWKGNINQKGKLLHIYHPSDIQLAGANLKKIKNSLKYVASSLGCEYSEHNNMSSNHEAILSTVSESKIVISSRLHGCIMAYSMGIPFVPLVCDAKIKFFLQSHTHLSGCNPTIFHDRDRAGNIVYETISGFQNNSEMLIGKINENKKIGTKIKSIISGY